MSNETHEPSQNKPPNSWFRFGLKSLLLVTALVAVYFGGRASTRPNAASAPRSGTWQMNMLSGHQRPITLTTLPGGLYRFNSGGNLGGTYRWQDRKLEVDTPDDWRFQGLAWQWDHDELVLVAEPPGQPAGPSYVGTRLRFVSPDISTTTQQSVPVVPSVIAARHPNQPVGLAHLQDREPAFTPTPWHEPIPAEWRITLPAGPALSAKLVKNPDGTFELTRAGVLNGKYEVRTDELEMVVPSDSRMSGLAWAWENHELVLVSEPSPPPTGSSYLGARMRISRVGGATALPEAGEK